MRTTLCEIKEQEKKRNHLTLELKNFIVKEKATKPQKTTSDLISDVSRKYEPKTATGTIHGVLEAKISEDNFEILPTGHNLFSL